MILKLMDLIDLSDGIHKAGNYAIRMMKWMIRDIYVE